MKKYTKDVVRNLRYYIRPCKMNNFSADSKPYVHCYHIYYSHCYIIELMLNVTIFLTFSKLKFTLDSSNVLVYYSMLVQTLFFIYRYLQFVIYVLTN